VEPPSRRTLSQSTGHLTSHLAEWTAGGRPSVRARGPALKLCPVEQRECRTSRPSQEIQLHSIGIVYNCLQAMAARNMRARCANLTTLASMLLLRPIAPPTNPVPSTPLTKQASPGRPSRLSLCAGSYDGARAHDSPLSRIVCRVSAARYHQSSRRSQTTTPL
jgi:hypothetical protein